MATGARIPRGIDDFNPYIRNTNAYLLAGTPSNAERLGVTVDEVTQWTVCANQWLPLHILYSDKKNSRTTSVKDQLLSIISQCVLLDQNSHILDRIAASPNVTIVDMETFNIKKGLLQKTTHTGLTNSIVEPVIPTIQPIGGGSLSIKCYSSTGVRAGIFEDADSVQYTFMVGDVPPTSADMVGMTKELSTKGAFTLSLGSASSGKHLYCYFRWYNTKYPTLAGPWSSMQSVLIL
jgi:hypothetical protein